MRRSPLALALFFGVTAQGCASSTAVTRSVRGRLVEGRFVSDEAYAAYLRGSVLEAKGNRDSALVAYGDGARHDPNSPELWTRIGELSCTEPPARSPAGGELRPEAAFDRAASLDPSYEEAWTARARCHMKRGELRDAVRTARVAVSLDPNRIEPPILLAQILERQGEIEEAARWMMGLAIRMPDSLEAQEALSAFAARTHDEGRRLGAERAVTSLRRATNREAVATAKASLEDVDAAIARGDFARARRFAIQARLSSGALAIRAVAVGSTDFAKSQADLVLAADPNDVDARVAAVVVADLMRDDEALAAALLHAPPPRAPISGLTTVLMGEVLERRVGRDAKQAWDAAVGTMPPAADPLVKTVTDR